MIYIVTVNFYSGDMISTLIRSLESIEDGLYKIVIVNNSPDDISLSMSTSEQITLIVNPENVGFGCACNIALSHIYHSDPTALVWFINPDAYLLDDSVQKVNIFFDTHNEVSILGTVINTPNGKCWFAGGDFNPLTGSITVTTKNIINKYGDCMLTSWVSGCSLIVNLKRFLDCPHFSPLFFLYYEDFDFCIRYSKQGHLVYITNLIHVVHKPSSVTNRNIMAKLKYSTSSYLIALSQYTNCITFLIRFIRIICIMVLLSPFRLDISLGKLQGIMLFAKLMKPIKK